MLPCEVAAPRLVGTCVESIAFGAHLKDDGVHPTQLEYVQLVGEVLLHIIARHALKLPIDALYPCAAKFALGQGVARLGDEAAETEGKGE